MTKADLIEEVASISGLNRKSSEQVVNSFFESIVDSLQHGQKVELRGFGTFNLRRRNARMGRNPRTGEQVHVPAKVVPFFKPGKDLKALINE